MRHCILSIATFLLIFTLSFTQDETSISLFEGIAYSRIELIDPRPIVVHLIEIDLTADIEFLVTPADNLEEWDYTARTTSDFVEKFGVQLAINGDFFGPVREDRNATESGVNIHGFTMSQGELVSTGYALREQFHTLYLSEEHDVSFTLDDFLIYQAISGNWMLIDDGELQEIEGDENVINNPHPRTVIGITEDRKTMLWVVVDGRQAEISEGMTIADLSQFLLDVGVYDALNLDGGGSSTLVVEDEDGVPILLNTPVDQDIIGQERPIANHLGIYASRLDD